MNHVFVVCIKLLWPKDNDSNLNQPQKFEITFAHPNIDLQGCTMTVLEYFCPETFWM